MLRAARKVRASNAVTSPNAGGIALVTLAELRPVQPRLSCGNDPWTWGSTPGGCAPPHTSAADVPQRRNVLKPALVTAPPRSLVESDVDDRNRLTSSRSPSGAR